MLKSVKVRIFSVVFLEELTAWKVSVCRFFLVQMWEITDQKISEYGHFSRSDW